MVERIEMIPIKRLNHAVLYVRDVNRSATFYRDVFGFKEVAREAGGRMAFLRASDSENHHDLGLFEIGASAPGPERGRVGLYHLAWEVGSVSDLAGARQALQEAGALTGESDHGATKSLYGHDPDGNEFEIMWMVPRAEWGDYENRAVVQPLDLDSEIARRS